MQRMRSILEVTTPADDLALLTNAELRAAAGVTGSAQDETLEMLGLGAAAAIMSECNIAVGSGSEPTLLRETLTQTFHCWPERADFNLGRRHNVEVTSVTIDDVAVDAGDYVVDAESGMLTRLNGLWCGRKIVVVYDAGFDEIPADLKRAVTEIFRASYAESKRDPFVKGQEIEIPGVERKRTDYWVGSIPGQANEGAVPDIVAGQLKRYRNLETSIG